MTRYLSRTTWDARCQAIEAYPVRAVIERQPSARGRQAHGVMQRDDRGEHQETLHDSATIGHLAFRAFDIKMAAIVIARGFAEHRDMFLIQRDPGRMAQRGPDQSGPLV